jgi:catechol 2,3-dioxygenase
MAEIAGSAAFLGAGGYHHHIGANIWQSAGAAPPPPGSAALRHATLLFPDEAASQEALTVLDEQGHEVVNSEEGPMARDPSGNAIVFDVA